MSKYLTKSVAATISALLLLGARPGLRGGCYR